MDKRDRLIRQQMETIRRITDANRRSVSSDLWGAELRESALLADEPTAKEAPDTSDAATQAPLEQQEVAESEKAPESIDDLKRELEGYIGLERVKAEVRDLIDMATVYRMRQEAGLPVVDLSMHMVFSGNPGTGKTMIARLMARVYKALGLLSKGQLIEVDRAGLVAGFVGQTAEKTSRVVDSAMGGVLFIDEAYTLSSRGESDYGQEAIDTLLKRMEDHREDLVVIVAGYTDQMQTFIHSNPGLESRFNKYLLFDDYTADEMMAIFRGQCEKSGYRLDDDAQPLVLARLQEGARSPSFGNARGVRNLFEQILVRQANRLAALPAPVDKETLMTITAADVSALAG